MFNAESRRKLDNNRQKILITGASGFIGSHIAEEALRRGMEVWCAVRQTTSKKYLQDERLNFINLNLSNTEQLKAALEDHQFDYIVHAAGATKCKDSRDFYRINTGGTGSLITAVQQTQQQLKRFVFVSSLSVYGAIREQQPYQPILSTDTPDPNTAYGHSKLKAENILRDSQLPYVILRPTGVYGPREKDYFLMVKSIKGHVDFSVGYKPQDITFVYVDDVVQAVFRAIDAPKEKVLGKGYFLSDGEVYQSRTFSDYIQEELGELHGGKKPWLLRIKAPLWVLKAVCFCGEYWGKWTNNITALNNDKYNILRQRNWQCDITPAREDMGYDPQVTLREGVRRSVRWYKENEWI